MIYKTELTIKDYIQLYPLVLLSISLIAGIIMGEHFPFSFQTLMIVMLGIIALAMLFSRNRRLASNFSFLYLIFFGALGIFLTKWANSQLEFVETGIYDTFHAIVRSDPTEKDDGAWVEVKAVDGRMVGKIIRLHIIYDDLQPKPQQLLGKCIKVKAKVRHPKNFSDSKFNYPMYLKSHGIAATATAYKGNWQVIDNHNFSLSPIDNMKIYFLSKRQVMVGRLHSLGMDNQAFAVTAAMALGDKSEVSRATSNIYSLAGTSHVLALSGLHLSIVFGLFAVFGGRWRRSILMVEASLVAMWIYVLLAGSPVSMIRSAIMLSISLLIGLSGRNSVTLNTLSFAAILILLVNPFAIHDVGFQLSFAAVAFLGAFASDISKIVPSNFLYQHRYLRWCWQMVVTSTVAQMGTTPLVAYHFGKVPLLFLPANFIAIPAATALLYLAVAFFLLLWLPLASQIIGYALSITSSFLNYSMTWIASISWSSLTVENMNLPTTVASYVLAIALMAILQYIGLWSSNKDQR